MTLTPIAGVSVLINTTFPPHLAGRLLRLRDIIGNPNTSPPIQPIIPVSRSTFLAGVKSGRYPKPFKLGPRVTVWRVEDLAPLLNGEVKK